MRLIVVWRSNTRANNESSTYRYPANVWEICKRNTPRVSHADRIWLIVRAALAKLRGAAFPPFLPSRLELASSVVSRGLAANSSADISCRGPSVSNFSSISRRMADRWIDESPLPRGLFRVYSSESRARRGVRAIKFARELSLSLSLSRFLSFSGKSERNPRKILVQFCRGAPYRDSAIIPRKPLSFLIRSALIVHRS